MKKKPEELLKELLDAEKLKYCFGCGICTASCPMVELLPNRYNPRALLLELSLDFDKVLKREDIWLCSWCYRCYKRCPQRLRLPDVLSLLRDMATDRGNLEGFEKALEIIKKDVPLAATCLHVRFHPERGNIDKPQVVDAIQRFIADYRRQIGEEKIPITTSRQKVAIIGSGPAGLTAALELSKKGYPVTVFESMSEPGGMLRRCIPEYRLPKRILNMEIERVKKQGIDIRTGVTIGKGLTIEDLSRWGYEAIFIATGAHVGKKLGIEGENLKGVMHAIELLSRVNSGEKVELGDKVVVIGGGNVAMDAAKTAIRLGAKEVSALCIEGGEKGPSLDPAKEMPAEPWESSEAEKEGVKIQNLVAPKKILGNDSQVSGVEFIKIKWKEPGENGLRRPIPIEGSEFTAEADTLILAIGQASDLSFLPRGIEIGRGNVIVVDPFTMQTDRPDIFAGGETVSGPATVIEAIADGKRATASIDNYLKNKLKVGK